MEHQTELGHGSSSVTVPAYGRCTLRRRVIALVVGPGGWLSGRDKREMVAGKAGPRPPVEATYLDVYASGALEHGGVAVSALIDDPHPSSRAKDPDGLAQRPGALFAASDVAEGQVAEHHVERPGRKGEIPRIGICELDPLADTLDHRVTLGGGLAVPRLVTQTPDVGSGRATPG
jgi:hypothetical protein